MAAPVLLAADQNSKVFDLPGYLACGAAGNTLVTILPHDLIPLPRGSSLFFLPDRAPVGFNAASGRYEEIRGLRPVAAFIPPGHTHLLTTAYKESKNARMLPLFSYTPVALYRGKFHVPAVRVDARRNHDICSLDKTLLAREVRAFQGTSNRLIRHLAHCAQTSFCPNAINFFLGKYECPLPASPGCNARCLGCISWQPEGSCAPTQERLAFVPTAAEIAEIALVHIRRARRPVVSFGQGCEGEPLLAADVIAEAVRMIRKRTGRGTIHMNTNASLPSEIDTLCKAGLDSFRVSLNSAREDLYHKYYMPRGYSFRDVCRSIMTAKRHGKFVALNYLTMPGFTDRTDEFKALTALVSRTGVDMIQWRNLNYDPALYFKRMNSASDGELLGVRSVILRLRERFPRLRHGYFNLPKESWQG